MAEENNKPAFNWPLLLRNVLTLLFIVGILYLLYKLGVVTLFILFGVVLSLVARPLYIQLEKINIGKFKIPGAVNAIISIMLVWSALFGIGAAIFPIVSREVTKISKVNPEKILTQMQDPINKGIEKLEKLGVLKFADTTIAVPEKIVERTVIYKIPCDTILSQGGYFSLDPDTVTRELESSPVIVAGDTNISGGIRHRKELEKQLKLLWNDYFNYGKVSKWFGSAINLVGNLLAIIASASFLAFFFLRDKSLFMKMVLAIVPEKYEKQTTTVLNDSRKMLSRYFIGLMLELLLVMVCTTIGLLIIGMRFDLAITIGFFCGFFNIVPYVGPLIGAALGLLLGITNHLEMDFYLVVFPLLIKMAIVFWIVQILDNNLFQTLIFSNSVKAHPIEIFLVIVIAGNIAGIAGMIFAIPGYTFIRIIARQFFSNFKVVRSLTKNM